MHRKPLLQERPFPVSQMLQPFPGRTPRALPLPTPRPKLKDLLPHLDWATLQHQHIKRNYEVSTQSAHRPPSPRTACTPHNPPGLGDQRRESPAARPSTVGRERAFTVTIGAGFQRRCAGPRPVMAKAASRSSANVRDIHPRHPPATSTRGIHPRHPPATSARGIHAAASAPRAVSCGHPPTRSPHRDPAPSWQRQRHDPPPTSAA